MYMYPDHSDVQTLQLSFATLYKLTDNIVEIIAKEGIEIDMPCVEEYHQALQHLFNGPFGILVNKVNQYSYGPGAMIRITSAPGLKAIAVVHYNHISLAATQTIHMLPQNRDKNLKKFWHRDAALDWLRGELV